MNFIGMNLVGKERKMRKLTEEEKLAERLIWEGRYEEAMEILKNAWSRLPDTSDEYEQEEDE